MNEVQFVEHTDQGHLQIGVTSPRKNAGLISLRDDLVNEANGGQRVTLEQHLWTGEQKRQQVSHGRHVDLLLKTLGHQRCAGAFDLFDVDASDGLGRVVRTPESDAGGRL